MLGEEIEGEVEGGGCGNGNRVFGIDPSVLYDKNWCLRASTFQNSDLRNRSWAPIRGSSVARDTVADSEAHITRLRKRSSSSSS